MGMLAVQTAVLHNGGTVAGVEVLHSRWCTCQAPGVKETPHSCAFAHSINDRVVRPQALEFASLDRIKLTHIRGNPLIRKDMARHVDISRSGGLEP